MLDESPAKAETIRDRIFALASIIASDRFGPGALASLRRGSPAIVMVQPAFLSLIAADEDRLADERGLLWATIVQAIAITRMAGQRSPIGKALALAKLSETRFVKLLAARGDGLSDQITLVARYLNAKQIPTDWQDLGELLLIDDWNEARAHSLRFRIAQDFYRQLHRPDTHPKSA